MDRLEEMKLDESGLRPDIANRIGSIANSLRSRGIGSYNRWESPSVTAASSLRHENPVDETETHEPQLVQLNLKSTLMGVRVRDDDEELFFSRQSSMSSMLSSGSVPFKWESEPCRALERPKAKIDIPWSPLTIPSESRGHSGFLNSQPFSTFNNESSVPSARSVRNPSGMLYPYPNSGSSCQLNAAHFTLDDHLLTEDLAGNNGVEDVEKIFKRLVGQSRLQQGRPKIAKSSDSIDARSDFITGGDILSDSPVSTLDCPQSPTTSERSFRGKSKRKSLRRRSEDANLLAAARVGPVDPSTPRPRSELAQYLMTINALTEAAMDDDDLEGPSEVAWLEPDDSPHDPDPAEACTPARGRKKASHERWSSNSSSWNLSLVPKPLRSVSTMVHRRALLNATVPGRSTVRRSKVDLVMHPISLTASYDGGTLRSRNVKKTTRSELNSGRSWWPDLGSGRRSSVWGCSGRLQMDVGAEPDLHEPDMEQANGVKSRHPQDAQAKVDEEDFPFETPIASSFLFREGPKTPSLATTREESESRASLHNPTISFIDSENDDLQFSDAYLDPEDGSITDSDGSHMLFELREGSEWVSSRSFKEYRDRVDGIQGFSGSLMSEFSGRSLSGCLDLGRSGRFSVDLQRGQKLDKAEHPRTPVVRLRRFKSDKSKRSILSPCLPFLHRSQNKNVPRLQQATVVGASSRRLHPVNSFTARLGPVAEDSTLAAHFQVP